MLFAASQQLEVVEISKEIESVSQSAHCSEDRSEVTSSAWPSSRKISVPSGQNETQRANGCGGKQTSPLQDLRVPGRCASLQVTYVFRNLPLQISLSVSVSFQD